MGKGDKITLSLKHKDRVKRAAAALGLTNSELVDQALEPLLDTLEGDLGKAAEAAEEHKEKAVSKLSSYPQMIQGNSSVRDTLKPKKES